MKKPNALITGASSGIGKTFAIALAEQGYTVTCVARREELLVDLISELGEGHRYIQADLTDPQQLSEVITDIEQSRYSLLVNNAGYAIYGEFKTTPLEQTQQLLQLNINSLVSLTHAYLQTASAGDAIINISSVMSVLPFAGVASYSGAKAFVTSFSEALWYECQQKGIYVVALLPGKTTTNFEVIASGNNGPGKSGGPEYPPETVVNAALEALETRKKPTIISGPKFRFIAEVLTRLLPRRVRISLMGGNSPGLSS